MRSTFSTPPPNWPPGPPFAAETLLELLLDENDREIILGDFEEEFWMVQNRTNPFQARAWYWGQVLHSTPRLLQLLIKRNITWRKLMENVTVRKHDNRWALAGFALLIPALLLVTGGLLFTLGFQDLTAFYDRLGLQSTLFHPLVVLGGMAAAIGSNFFRVFRFKVRREGASLVSTITVQGKLLNLLLIGTCLAAGAVIFIYLLVENMA